MKHNVDSSRTISIDLKQTLKDLYLMDLLLQLILVQTVHSKCQKKNL